MHSVCSLCGAVESNVESRGVCGIAFGIKEE